MSEYVVEEPSSQSASWRVHERIVRCRDCKYAHHYHPFNPYTRKPSEIEDWYCGWHSNAEGASEIEPDGFCAWGERRDA